MDQNFSGQIFRQATRIPDARGGRAPNSHGGLILEPRGRRGAPPKYEKKPRESSKMGGIGSALHVAPGI